MVLGKRFLEKEALCIVDSFGANKGRVCILLIKWYYYNMLAFVY